MMKYEFLQRLGSIFNFLSKLSKQKGKKKIGAWDVARDSCDWLNCISRYMLNQNFYKVISFTCLDAQKFSVIVPKRSTKEGNACTITYKKNIKQQQKKTSGVLVVKHEIPMFRIQLCGDFFWRGSASRQGLCKPARFILTEIYLSLPHDCWN